SKNFMYFERLHSGNQEIAIAEIVAQRLDTGFCGVEYVNVLAKLFAIAGAADLAGFESLSYVPAKRVGLACTRPVERAVTKDCVFQVELFPVVFNDLLACLLG